MKWMTLKGEFMKRIDVDREKNITSFECQKCGSKVVFEVWFTMTIHYLCCEKCKAIYELTAPDLEGKK